MKDNRVILLDCFGLFAPDPFGGYFKRHFGEGWRQVKDHYCEGADIGCITVTEMLEQMKTDLGISPEDAMKEILSYSKPDPEMIALATRFRQKHDVILLSNCMDGMIEKIFVGSGFDGCFDHQFRSYQLHRIKPGKEIYEYVLQALGPREKIIFFDDNQVNVDAGNHCGIPSVLFESVSQCEQVLFHEGY